MNAILGKIKVAYSSELTLPFDADVLVFVSKSDVKSES